MSDPSRDAPPVASVEDFLAWAEGRDEKWQLLDGVLVMMAGGSEAHAAIAANAIAELHARLRGTGCRPYGSDLLVRIGHRTGVYPDVSVTCQRERGAYITAPVVVIEVLSESTERDDRGRKWRLYQRLDSLRHYVLLDQERIRAEVWDRLEEGRGWRYRLLDDPDATIELAALGLTLPLRALYVDALPADEAPLPADETSA